MAEAPAHLLLVEDNPGDARLLQEDLAESTQPRFTVAHVVRLSEALSCLQADRFDLILLDLSLPDSRGLETVKRIRTESPRTPMVVLTGLADEATGVEAVREGAQDYLVKGQSDRPTLFRAIRYALERHRIEATLARYRDQLEELVAQRTRALATTNEVLQGEILERSRAEEALKAARRKLETDREAQRRRLALELHDAIGQELIGLKLALEHVHSRSRTTLAPEPLKALAGAIDKCMSLVGKVRTISHGLYPTMLESLGLAAALRTLAEYHRAIVPVTVRYDETLESARFPTEAEIAVFRIAHEALLNAVRHGRASQIEIRLNFEGDALVLCVTDNGIGFDPDRSTGKGLGLISMRDRASTVGGELIINSQRGETSVRARIPVGKANAV